MQNENHTHQSVSTMEREEVERWRSSVVERKDEGRRAARRNEECHARGVAVDHVAVARRTHE
jgi:hypothetical protein